MTSRLQCGQCRHWVPQIGVTHIRLGRAGACARPEGQCGNDRGQYQSPDEAPLERYAKEPAGAHYAPITAERTEG